MNEYLIEFRSEEKIIVDSEIKHIVEILKGIEKNYPNIKIKLFEVEK